MAPSLLLVVDSAAAARGPVGLAGEASDYERPVNLIVFSVLDHASKIFLGKVRKFKGTLNFLLSNTIVLKKTIKLEGKSA